MKAERVIETLPFSRPPRPVRQTGRTGMNKPNPYESPKTNPTGTVPPEPRGLRWYHYALRRLPVSLLITVVTLVAAFLAFYFCMALAQRFGD
jgi:hypothetical protein